MPSWDDISIRCADVSRSRRKPFLSLVPISRHFQYAFADNNNNNNVTYSEKVLLPSNRSQWADVGDNFNRFLVCKSLSYVCVRCACVAGCVNMRSCQCQCGGLSAGATSSRAKCAKLYCDMHKLNGLSFGTILRLPTSSLRRHHLICTTVI